MNNTGRRIRFSAALVVLCTFPIFSQSIPANRAEKLILGSQEISSSGIIAAADPRVPIPQLLPEPLYTYGDSNDVFWALPDSFVLDNTIIKIGSCQLQFQAASDADFKIDTQETPEDKYPRADQKSYRITSTGFAGKTRWYRARTISPTPSGPFGSFSEWSAPQRCISDLTPPTLTSFQALDAGGNRVDLNRWSNQSTIILRFSLEDPAGVSRAFLSGDMSREVLFLQDDTLKGNPGPSTVTAEWRLQQLADGQYALALGASDAAYAPESHGPSEDGKITAVWKLQGNRSDALHQFALRIDTRPPQIDLTQINAVYTAKKSLEIIVSDELSGIDTTSLQISFSKIPFQRKIQACTPAQPNCFQVLLTLGNISNDTMDTLTVTVRDLAGNARTERKAIRFIVEPPILSAVSVRDLDWGSAQCLSPAASYTNEAFVKIDLTPAPNSKPADSLKIVNADDPTRSITLRWPANNSIPSFDLRSIVSGLFSGQKVRLLFYALDRYGNMQPQGVPAGIIYDNVLPVISHIALADRTDTTDVRRRAYGGWTNDDSVRVTLKADEILYRIEQLQPSVKCRENEVDFIETLPESDGVYEFSYQAADSAGNTSEIVSARIRLDTQIENPTTEDFRLADDLNVKDRVRIVVTSQKWPDLSRMVVNGQVYRISEGSVSVPEDRSGYWVALIDSAGNESNAVKLAAPCPTFRLSLADTSKVPNDASSGYTNDLVISWALSEMNFRQDKLQSVIFYDSLLNRFITQKGSDKGLLNLKQLYPALQEKGICRILTKVLVTNWPQCDPDSLVEATIVYDAERPRTEILAVQDTVKNPFAAAPGFSNDAQLKLCVQTPDQDVWEISLTGTPEDQINGQSLPFTAGFDSCFTWTLNNQGEFVQHNLRIRLKDWAGNWSDEKQAGVRYLKQVIEIPHRLDTVQVSVPVPKEIKVSFSVQCSHAEFLNSVFITKPEGSKDSTKIDEWNSASRQLTFSLSNPSEGLYRFAVSDSAGNGSNEAQLYIDIQEPPKIHLTVFDAKTFPSFKSPTTTLPQDWERSDSLYTCADSLVVLTRLISGDWDKTTIVLGEQVLYAGPVSDKGGKYDLRKIALPLPNNDLQVVKIRAVVVNREGVADSDEADIVWDNRAPRLARFEGAPLVSEPNYLFAWEGNDEQPDGSAGEPAGLLLIERYDDETTNKSEIRTLYYPITGTSGQDTLTLMDKFGVHTLTAFLVDKADADQNRPDSMAVRIGRGDTSWMTHPSESKSISVRYNPIEVANFPNPFDPTKEYTSLIFPINSDDGSPVRITILDAFGRLVHKKEVVCKKRFQVGDDSDAPELRWDGRNDRGEIVANGGYICIIDVLKTGERYVRKIAVLKANSTN